MSVLEVLFCYTCSGFWKELFLSGGGYHFSLVVIRVIFRDTGIGIWTV